MRRILFVVIPVALGLNFWLGDRVPIGTFCPILASPERAVAVDLLPSPAPDEEGLLDIAR